MTERRYVLLAPSLAGYIYLACYSNAKREHRGTVIIDNQSFSEKQKSFVAQNPNEWPEKYGMIITFCFYDTQ